MSYKALIDQILNDDELESDLTEDILIEVYNALKNTAVEDTAWRKIVFLYNKPLSNQIAFDLIDRKIAVTELGHTKQENEVMWKLAEMVEEALLTLAIDIYTKPSFSIEETEYLFNSFYNSRWMIETLIQKEPSSLEKRKLLVSAIQKNSDSDSLKKLLASVDNAKLARRHDLSDEEFDSLFQTNEPYVWLSLSKNPNTPVEILNKLLNVKNIKNARQIRNSASVILSKHNSV